MGAFPLPTGATTGGGGGGGGGISAARACPPSETPKPEFILTTGLAFITTNAKAAVQVKPKTFFIGGLPNPEELERNVTESFGNRLVQKSHTL
jgi:hypothetical protein